MVDLGDPHAPILFGVTMILVAALFARVVSRRLGLPTLVGELVVGIVLGNVLALVGYDLITVLRESGPVVPVTALAGGTASLQPAGVWTAAGACEALAELLSGPKGREYLQVLLATEVFFDFGILFLLFHLGLGANLSRLRQISSDSAAVAALGMLAPFGLGILAYWLIAPQAAFVQHLFVASTLAATGVAVTTQAFQRLGREDTSEARTVFGAALLDDVAVLIVMAFAMTVMTSDVISGKEFVKIMLLSTMFLVVAVFLGPRLLGAIVLLLGHFNLLEAKLFISLIFALSLAWFASVLGISALLGAFVAGLLIHEHPEIREGGATPQQFSIEDLLAPLEAVLVPVFFLLIGIQVKLEIFSDPRLILAAVGIIVAAIAGKLVSGRVAQVPNRRLIIGIGMLPRGEVGVVFAAVGKVLGVINTTMFSIVVLMVITTTLLAPPLLRQAYRRLPKTTEGAPT